VNTSILAEELAHLSTNIEHVQRQHDALQSELRSVEKEVEAFSDDMQRFDALRDVCVALGKLGGGLPQNGADIHDRIGIRPELAASGGPYAYLLRPVSKKLVVKIPPGVRAGQRIRLTGMGMPGRNGGKDGDLFLEVRLRRPFLSRVKNFIAGIIGQ